MNEIKLLKKKRKAKSEGNHKLLTAITADLSELYMKSGQFQQAIEELIDLANFYKLENNNIEYAKANRAIGEAYLGLNNYKKALEHQKLYLDIATREKNNIEVQRAYATIGHIYLTTYLENQVNPEENLNAAYKYFMKSMKLCESLNISKLEKADMQARLLSNLGLVKDSSGDYDKAIELFTTSINICKNNDIYEQLTRGHIALASLFDRQNDGGKSLQQYNLAIEAAKKLKDNVDLMCDALLAKSEALIKLGDFHSTKKILYKAYKLNSPNLQNRKIIERNLKAVVVMCRTEDKLIIESNNNNELKKLYEKMGDCACTLKNFSKALEYYKLMLTYAEKSGISGRELSSCYYSLAETYKDNKMYNKAVEYFEKEYLLCTELKDRLNTLSNIADTKETANCSIIEIREIYDRAIQASKLDNNIKEERRMITRCMAYLERVKDENGIKEMENKLDSLSIAYKEFSSDSESIISDLSEDKENNIDLSNITDVSDESDNERNPVCDAPVSTGKRRSKNFIIKKNAKGESQLHVACINGKIPVVKHLLEQGHPLNLRDNSGWLPIHEACNHGHYEITKLLIEKGATLNDRGGVKCEGITPLYDAANNGHLKIVELLLESGASATIKSDNGDTPLNVLQLWHQKYPFVGEDFDLYQKIIQKLTDSLKKVGSTVTVESKQKDVYEETASDEELEGENFSIRDSSPDFVDEYHEIMKNLGKKSSKSTTYTEPNIPSSSKRSALILENDLFDDWLEDDIQPAKTTKKRKTSSLESLVTSTTMVTNSSSKSSPLKRLSDDDIRPVNYDVLDISNSPSKFISQNLPKKSIQCSLLDSGFNRKSSSANKKLSSLQRHRSLESSSSAKQKKITSFSSFVEADSTVPQLVQTQNQIIQPQESIPNISLNADLMVYVDVKIEEKIYRVAVLLSQIQSNTIGWLADQAAQKYARKECSKPSLEIETESGVLLSDDDPLSLLFPLGTRQAETVVGRIIKLYMTPLVDRYRDACLQMKEGPNKELMTILEETSVKLNLCNRGFPSDILSPLCKALNHQTTLLELNISGNFIGNSCMTILCASLNSLVNLSCLNLRCTGLTTYHLIELVKMFSVSSEQILGKLKHLDLSNNYLKNNSLPHLIEITKKLKLETLNISNIALRNGVEVALELNDICNLNISENHFFPEKFISSFIPNKLTNLDISRTLCKNFSLISDDTLFEHNIFASLECLNVSCTDLEDNGLYKILRSCTSKSFLKLDVSYNYLLTGISLRRLLEHTTLEEINLIGCDKILQYFPEDFGRTVIRTKKNKIKLLFSYIDQMSDNLINQFKILYNDCLIENANNLLIISTKE